MEAGAVLEPLGEFQCSVSVCDQRIMQRQLLHAFIGRNFLLAQCCAVSRLV
jgi:hypothetical protein